MLKFLRRYNKWILAVGGTLLLITFLIPQAFQGLQNRGQSAGTPWATFEDEDHSVVKLTLADQFDANREIGVIHAMPGGRMLLEQIWQVTKPEHWYLLTLEAERAGLVGGPAAGDRFLQEPRDLMLSSLVSATQQNPQFVRQTLAKLGGVMMLRTSWEQAPILSDVRMKNAAQRLYHSAAANMVVIEASKEAPTGENVAPPTEEQLKAQFEKYSDKLPGEGEEGFGYKLPNRVKLEWLSIPNDSIRKLAEASPEFSETNQRKFWRQQAKADATLEQPEGAKPVPEVIRSRLLDQLAQTKRDQIAKFIDDQIHLSQVSLPRSGGYYVLPDDWDAQRLSLEAFAQSIQKEFGIELPQYRAEGDKWLTIEDITKLPGLGEASTSKFSQEPVSVGTLVAAAKELAPSPSIQIQKGIASPSLRDLDGSLYVMRIIDVDPSRPPHSLDEVRDQVVADLNRQINYNQLAAQLDSLRQEALEKGLIRFALEHDTAVNMVGGLRLLQPRPLPIIGQDKDAVEKMIELARQLPADQATADLPAEQRTFALPVEKKLAVVIGQFTSSMPLTMETYRILVSPGMSMQGGGMGQLPATMRAEELENNTLTEKAFGYDSVIARHKFQSLLPTEDEDAQQTASAN